MGFARFAWQQNDISVSCVWVGGGGLDGWTDDTRIHPHWGEEVPIRTQQERDRAKTSPCLFGH